MSVTCDESEGVAALDGDGNRGEDVVCEGMVGGEGEEVAGGGAELVDEVRGLLADAAGGLYGEGDEVRLLAVGDLRVLAALGCSGVLGLDEVLLAGGSEVGGGEGVSDDYVGEDVSVGEDDLQVGTLPRLSAQVPRLLDSCSTGVDGVVVESLHDGVVTEGDLATLVVQERGFGLKGECWSCSVPQHSETDLQQHVPRFAQTAAALPPKLKTSSSSTSDTVSPGHRTSITYRIILLTTAAVMNMGNNAHRVITLCMSSSSMTFFHLLLLLAAVVTLSIHGTDAASAPALVLPGGGSSLAAPLYASAILAYSLQTPTVSLTYSSTSSGSGRSSLLSGAYDFADSDSVLPAAFWAAHPDSLCLPVLAAAVVPIFNVPQVGALQLTQTALSSIFMGSVAYWNDSAIAASNPGVGPSLRPHQGGGAPRLVGHYRHLH